MPEKIMTRLLTLFGNKPIKRKCGAIEFETIKAAIEILNSAVDKCLPQYSRHDSAEKTKDGLDKRLKVVLHNNTSYAKYVSDLLAEHNICKIIQRKNTSTGKNLKCTQLLKNWTW